jgi:hypothetical protein
LLILFQARFVVSSLIVYANTIAKMAKKQPKEYEVLKLYYNAL